MQLAQDRVTHETRDRMWLTVACGPSSGGLVLASDFDEIFNLWGPLHTLTYSYLDFVPERDLNCYIGSCHRATTLSLSRGYVHHHSRV